VAKLTQQHKVSDPHLLHQLPHGCIFFPEITFLAISSTLIREQLANKSNPQYLLPDRVLDYIHQQQLYFKTNKL
jgi:nicotinate-nucleotide adenylyltransferase